jgi:uncharacterized protein YoxC
MADTSFQIDINAQVANIDQTNAQLDALTAQLSGSSGSVASFEAAIEHANKSLANGRAEYALLERAAAQASKAMERAALKGTVPAEVAANARKANDAVNSYAGTLKKLEHNAGLAAKKQTELSKEFLGGKKNVGDLKESLVSVGGPLGKLGSSVLGPTKGFTSLASSIGMVGAAAVVGVAAIAAIAAAAVYATAKLLAFAVSAADTARNASLTRDAFETLNPELVGLRTEFDSLTKQTGIQANELRGFVTQLEDAKVSAADMPEALRAVAIAERALGKGGSTKFFKDIKKGKQAVRDLARETQSKFGGIVSKQMRSLDAQGDQLHHNIGALFAGLNIEPVLTGFERLVGLFDENTASGKTLKALFDHFLQPLIDAFDTASVMGEAFFLGIEAALLKAYIAFKPLIKFFVDLFGLDDPTTESTLDAIFKAAEILTETLIVLTAIVAGALFIAFVALASPVLILIGVFYAWYYVLQFVFGYLASLDLATMGKDLIMGLVRGITGAAGFVVDAIKNTITRAIRAAKDLLGIKSPSKVFAGLGAFTAEGFAGGVEESAPQAQSALSNMVSPPVTSGEAASAGAGAAAGGGGGSANFAGATFVFNGVAGAEDAEARFAELLTRIFEGDAAQLGGAPA